MKPDSNSAKRATTGEQDAAIPFGIFSQNELLLWPYRALSKALLRVHHNTVDLIRVNRTLADEMRDIIRRQQDFTLDLTEKLLHRTEKGASASTPESLNEYFDSMIAGVREFSTAVSEAQIHSIEALRERARDAEKSKPQAQVAE